MPWASLGPSARLLLDIVIVNVHGYINHFYAVRVWNYRIRHNKGHFAVQGHSMSPIFVPIESYIRLPISDYYRTNLPPPILHHFGDTAFQRWKIAIFGYPSCVYTPRRGRGSPGTISIKFSVDVNGWPRYVPNGEEILPKISIGWVGRTIVTDSQTTDRRNVNVSSRSLKKW